MKLHVTDLWPFGIKVEPLGSTSLLDVDPQGLDRLAEGEKLVLLRGFDPLTREEFLDYCRSFPRRQLLEWDFGPVMEMRERPDPTNYLFSREAVP
jgi:hypothetical protein